jgi:mannose-1-phosphate guanylyltransferase
MAIVMLLAAGYGTRLRPLTDRLPKALVPIGDQPIIAHVIDSLRGQLGDFQLVLNAHHKAELVAEYVHNQVPNAQVLVEPGLLGTAGGVRAAWPNFRGEPVLVANADILSNPNYPRLLQTAGNTTCCLCVCPRRVGEGSVGVAADGSVVRLRGEVFGVEVSGGDYMGIAVLGTDAIDSLPDFGCLVGDWLLPRLRRGEIVRAHFDTTVWSDVGELKAYAQANWAWLSVRNLSSWVAPDASICDGARLTEVVMGSGTSIEAVGSFQRVIAWPGARLTQELSDCIVLDDGQVVALADHDWTGVRPG